MSGTVLRQRQGNVGRIRLDNPKTTNAMSLEMINALQAALDHFAHDSAAKIVVIDHTTDPGFCVGGDAIGLAKSGRADGKWASDYFARQAELNLRLHRYEKPVMTIADGPTIGGGLGLLLAATHRVVTERSMIAFMEPSVGMVPDVGASWVLPRLPGATGMWLALTGSKLVGKDIVNRGLADLYVSQQDLAGLIDQFARDAAATLPRTEAGQVDEQIDAVFGLSRLEDILSALQSSDDRWPTKQLASIRRASPEAIVETFRLMRRGADFEDFAQALAAEVAINSRLVRGHDWLSFARANLLERDQPLTRSFPTIKAALEGMGEGRACT